MLEENLRRAMILGRGDPTVFLTRPISLTLLVLTVLVLIVVLSPQVRRKRDEVFVEGDQPPYDANYFPDAEKAVTA